MSTDAIDVEYWIKDAIEAAAAAQAQVQQWDAGARGEWGSIAKTLRHLNEAIKSLNRAASEFAPVHEEI